LVALADILSRHANRDSAQYDHWIRGILIGATLVNVLAASIRTWAGSYLHSTVIHDAALHSDQLVADGPYRHLRNPLYLGTIIISIGFGLVASRAGFVVLVVGNILFNYRLILREETNLLQSQGENYRRYLGAVPRLIPSLTPRVSAGGGAPDWRDGFTGELFFWSFAAAMAVFAATERVSYYWIVLGAGFAVYFLQNYLRARAKRAA
jgi:protein-S-isoprenylcysteine O-methyltransferase Ste14